MLKLIKACGAIAAVISLAACQTTSSMVDFSNVKLSPNHEGEALKLRGSLTKPEGIGPFPAVVLLHTAGGMGTGPIVDFWPDYLAKLGYVSLVVDSYGPRGMRRFNNAFRRVYRDEVSRDAYGALAYLARQPFVDKERVGVIGFSMGAIVIAYFSRQKFETPNGLNFKAAVSMYGYCSIRGPKRNYRGAEIAPSFPWVIIIGDKEDPAYLESCVELKGRPGIELHVLEGVYHAFDNPKYTTLSDVTGDSDALYSEEGTKKAQDIIKAALGRYLAK